MSPDPDGGDIITTRLRLCAWPVCVQWLPKGHEHIKSEANSFLSNRYTMRQKFSIFSNSNFFHDQICARF